MHPADSMKKRKDLLSQHLGDMQKEVEEEVFKDPAKEDLHNDSEARHNYDDFLREEFEDPEHSDVLIEKQSRPDEKSVKKRPKA